MSPFRAAVDARDFEGAVALLADDVVFRSPVVFQPYHGRIDELTVMVRPLSAALALRDAMRCKPS